MRSLLDRDKDDDTPNLNVLLCETYTAVYLSLLVYGLATCDCHILYRLVTQKPNTTVWAQIFGGGTKKVIFSSEVTEDKCVYAHFMHIPYLKGAEPKQPWLKGSSTHPPRQF